ncbi:tumor necrosis factor receptor superfamily member 5-like [Petromyzon marinus]|uniref:Tumor necrosis factor receptor superfamily member 5-like n=1 Tax=Petromyzon marinus TaxID=7757 RepID=A0AAJ7TUC4_PETMA|nr:tumor necrosis factor receptor superfamily member 5-like [Petromyzon marinus]
MMGTAWEYVFAITVLTTRISFVVPGVGAPPMSHPHLEARGRRFLCDAGLYLRADELGAAGRCEPCPAGTFTAFANTHSTCLPCRRCDSVRGFREAQRCTADADTECECQEGRFCPSSPCQEELCVLHFACPAGMGVTSLGSAVLDTKCFACPPDSFSNETSATQTCRPHTRCDRDGRLTIANGTSTRDSECGARTLAPAKEDEPPGAVKVGHIHWIVPLSVAIFITVFFACCFDYYKRRESRHIESNNYFQANVIQVGDCNMVVHDEKQSLADH